MRCGGLLAAILFTAQVGYDEGGRSKVVDESKKAGKTIEEIEQAVLEAMGAPTVLTEGFLEVLQRGWFWNSWIPQYVSAKTRVRLSLRPARVTSAGDLLFPDRGERFALAGHPDGRRFRHLGGED